eukprot:symbB.v1.2.007866.t1/scaffold448.1/size203282/18
MAAEEDAAGLECELLGKWGSFGWWLQVFLGAVCMASLIGKRFTDKVRRSWKVWFFDTAKQGTQALMNHIINIGLALASGWKSRLIHAIGIGSTCLWIAHWVWPLCNVSIAANVLLDLNLQGVVITVTLLILRTSYGNCWTGRQVG